MFGCFEYLLNIANVELIEIRLMNVFIFIIPLFIYLFLNFKA